MRAGKKSARCDKILAGCLWNLVASRKKILNICIAPGAFMAFHAVRSMERKEYMEHETWSAYHG